MSRDVKNFCEIYGIYDSQGCLRYIGKANNAAKRFQQHLRETRRQTPFYNWVRKCVRLGEMPVCKVLEVCPVEDWERCEKEHIFQARLRGENLLNLADGGDCPKTNTEQLRANATRLNKTRLRGYHRLTCEIGRGIKFAVERGSADLLVKLNAALARLRSLQPDQKQRLSVWALEKYPSWR
jgi:hypothetical protein